MRLRADITSLTSLLDAELKAGQKAVQTSIRDAGISLRDAWRAQVMAAGMGARLPRTIRSDTWPRSGNSLNAASMVWTRAPVIVSAHNEGTLVRSKHGLWLAIPTEAAGRAPSGKGRTPDEWERRTGLRLVFVHRRGRASLLIAQARLNKSRRAVASRSKTGRGLMSVPIFIMVPQVSLRKRLDLEAPTNRVLAALPDAIERRWRRG